MLASLISLRSDFFFIWRESRFIPLLNIFEQIQESFAYSTSMSITFSHKKLKINLKCIIV